MSKLLPLRIRCCCEHSNFMEMKCTVNRIHHLAYIIASVCVDKLKHAEGNISQLRPNLVVPSNGRKLAAIGELLGVDCQNMNKIIDKLQREEKVSRYISTLIGHRDAMLFEIITWIASMQTYYFCEHKTSSNCNYIKNPHDSVTDHGLDGLIINLNERDFSLNCVTLVECKCTNRPKEKIKQAINKFKEYNNIKGIKKLHNELKSILEDKIIIIDDDYDNELYRCLEDGDDYKRYCVAITVSNGENKNDGIKKIFHEYSNINTFTNNVENSKLNSNQKIAMYLSVEGDFRIWYCKLAKLAAKFVTKM